MTTMINDKPPTTLGGIPVEEFSSSAKRGKRYRVNLALEVNEEAADIVRADFNPSRNVNAGMIKLLSAVLITMAQDAQDRPLLPTGSDDAKHVANERLNHALVRAIREAAIGITHIETGAMFLVKAATS